MQGILYGAQLAYIQENSNIRRELYRHCEVNSNEKYLLITSIVSIIYKKHFLQKLVESHCQLTGKEIVSLTSIADLSECLSASQLFHGQYYEYESFTQTCKVYDSNERTCNIQRAPAGVSNCQEENLP